MSKVIVTSTYFLYFSLFSKICTLNIEVEMASCSPKYMLSFQSAEFAKERLLNRNYIFEALCIWVGPYNSLLAYGLQEDGTRVT